MSDVSERSHFRCEFPDRHDASIALKSWDKLRTLTTVADNLVERNSNVAESLAEYGAAVGEGWVVSAK